MRTSYFLFVCLFAFLFATNLFTQDILWEKEVASSQYFQRTIAPKIIEDNSQNYVIGVQVQSMRNPVLVKIRKDGEFDFLKAYYPPYSATNKMMYLTREGKYLMVNSAYKDTTYLSASPNRVPQIMLIDTSGDTLSLKCNEGITDSLTYINDSFEDYTLLDQIIKNKNDEIIAADTKYRTEENAVIWHFRVKKYNSDASLKWKRNYDSIQWNSNYLYHYGISLLNDGSYQFLLLYTPPNDGDKEFHILRIDDNGNKLFLKKLIIPDLVYKMGENLTCSDGSVILDGYCQGNYQTRYFVRTDKNCDSIIKKKVINDANGHAPNKLYELSDGNIIEAGYRFIDAGPDQQSPDDNTYDLFIRKLDKNFDIMWEKTWKKQVGNVFINDIIETSDGNILVAGYSDSGSTYFDNLYVAKFKDTTLMSLAVHGSSQACRNTESIYSVRPEDNTTISWKAENGTVSGPSDADTVRVIWNDKGIGKLTLIKKGKYSNRIDSTVFVVNINDLPEKPTITKNNDTLVSSYDTGNQWYKDGISIKDATSNTYYPEEKGHYSVSVTLNGCTSEMSDAVDITTGIDEWQAGQGLQIFPQPVSDMLYLKSALPISAKVQIITVEGIVVLETAYSEKINLSGLVPGLYFLRINNNLYKFVKL